MTNVPSILTVKNLSKRFGGIIALKNVNFIVNKGTITALIGPNGAGKTTLFNCLTGFYCATHGELLFQPYDKLINIQKMLGEPFSLSDAINPISSFSKLYFKMFGGSHLATRAGIARTFQHIRLFREMTVIENCLVAQHLHAKRNVLSGLFNTKDFQQSEKNAIEYAYYWLEKFSLTPQANRLAGELPYGKQRHLEIARAMCTKPSLLCLDEPAAGLNTHESLELSELIQTLRRENNITVILIEHDMSLVMKISDHIIVLDHGVVISEGSAQQVRQDKRVIEAYLGVAHE